MLKIYFGNDEQRNNAIKQRLDRFQIAYDEYQGKDIDLKTLLNLFINVPDMFDLLTPKMLKYKLDNKLKLTQFGFNILQDIDNCLKLPIFVTDKNVYSDVTAEEVSIFLPRNYRKAERIRLYKEFEKLDKEHRFWRNFDIIRQQAELRWYEFNDLMFSDISDDLGEVKKAKDRFFNYSRNKQIPPQEIIDKMADILMVNQDDFYKTSVSDLKNY